MMSLNYLVRADTIHNIWLETVSYSINFMTIVKAIHEKYLQKTLMK